MDGLEILLLLVACGAISILVGFLIKNARTYKEHKKDYLLKINRLENNIDCLLQDNILVPAFIPEGKDETVNWALAGTHKVLNHIGLTIPEIILYYGNLGYHLGAAAAGIPHDKGPSIEVLKEHYKNEPTVDVGLMYQGLLVTSWEADFKRSPKISDLGKKTVK